MSGLANFDAGLGIVPNPALQHFVYLHVHAAPAITNKHTQLDTSESTINISIMNKYEANQSRDVDICLTEV